MNVQKVVTSLLIGFVLLSIGFAAGRYAARREAGGAVPTCGGGAVSCVEQSPTVQVYYMHATARCMTCNALEKMTREVVEAEFAAELEAGVVTMSAVDFQKNEALAARYEVTAGCVVVTHLRDGEEVAHQRLEEIWALKKDPPAFNRYVGDVIRGYLADGEAD